MLGAEFLGTKTWTSSRSVYGADVRVLPIPTQGPNHARGQTRASLESIVTGLHAADAALIQGMCCTWIAMVEQVEQWQHDPDLGVVLGLIWEGESVGRHLRAMQDISQNR